MSLQIRAMESLNSHVADGVQTIWNFSFAGGYISQDHVKVMVVDASGNVTTPTFSFLGPYQLLITPAIVNNVEVTIYRATPTDASLVNFTDGSEVTEASLDLLAKQAVFAAAEAKDWAKFSSQFSNSQLLLDVAAGLQGVAQEQYAAALAQANAAAANASASAAAAALAITSAHVADYAAVRAYNGSATILYVTDSEQGGIFRKMVGDTTSVDDGATMLVASNGSRWKRSHQGMAMSAWFAKAAQTGTALMLAETAYPGGVGINLGTGSFNLDVPVVLNEGRMNLVGAGRWASLLRYDFSDAGPAVSFNNSTLGGYNQGRITDVAFLSSTNTDKTMLDLRNVANVEVARVATHSGAWPGAHSIGIHTAGRQVAHIHGCEIGCARPIVISENPTWPSLAADHFLIELNELTCSSAEHDVIEVEDKVSFASTTFRHLALQGGRDGIRYKDLNGAAASFAVMIDEVRVEQGMADPVTGLYGYSVNLESVQSIQNVKVQNSYFDSRRNGVRLRNVQNAIIENTVIASTAGKTALDIVMVPGGYLHLRNVFLQAGSLISITNAKCIRRTVRASGLRGLTLNEEWVYDNGSTAEGTLQSDSYHTGKPIVVAANGGTAVICDKLFNGKVVITTSDHVTAEFLLAGSANQIKEAQDLWNFFTVPPVTPAGNYEVFQDGSQNYCVRNNMTSDVTFYVHRIGFGQ